MSSRHENNCDSIQILANQRGAIELVLRQVVIEMTKNKFENFVSYLQSALPLVQEVRAIKARPKLQLVSPPAVDA